MRKKGIKARLIRLFAATSIIPIIIFGVFSYYNIAKTLHENTEITADSSLRQMDNNLNLSLESYEDLLYQIYTDDNMVSWTDKLKREVEEAVTVNQMRRFLSSLLYTKEFIRAITVIAPGGAVVTYEQMTPATFRCSWLPEFSMSAEELYADVIRDYQTHIYPTEFGTNFANKDYYLFHMAHRIIDYHGLNKECGIVIISIDEEFLEKICLNATEDDRVFSFLIDGEGRVISFGSRTELIGQSAAEPGSSEEERLKDYRQFLRETGGYPVSETEIYLLHDDALGWDIVNTTDLSGLRQLQRRQLYLILFLSILTMAVVILISTGMSQNLLASVRQVVDGMKEAQSGDLSVRIEKDARMPLELESIADGFNDTLFQLNHAIERQREAQIVALEAQINPHFLYNTLDTINWMAIDHDEYDISNAISALANILRYAIVNSNAEVTVKEELEWLKKYIYLQQYRLKGRFSCEISADPDAQNAYIHKLLLQPFVENAIRHGFDTEKEDALLSVRIDKEQDELVIVIEDNGTGISPEVLEKINQDSFSENTEGGGIGMQNAMTRLRMYYGMKGKMRVEAVKPHGTRVLIMIPYTEK